MKKTLALLFLALSMPLRDLSSGFRMYRREVLEGMNLLSRDFDVLEEILIRVHAEGWVIRQQREEETHDCRHSERHDARVLEEHSRRQQ